MVFRHILLFKAEDTRYSEELGDRVLKKGTKMSSKNIGFLALIIVLGMGIPGFAQQENFKLLFHAVGPTPTSALGIYISSVGDWNQDGFGDVYAYITSPELSGEYCRDYYGGEPMDTIPDMYFNDFTSYIFGREPSYSTSLSGDLYGDFTLQRQISTSDKRVSIYFGSEIPDSIPDFSLSIEPHIASTFGAFSTIGDVNGDGYDDFGTGDVNVGKIYIYYGGPDLDSIPDFTMSFGQTFGSSLSIDGDVNNDGYNDILCQSSYGVYLFYGGTELDSIPDWFLPHYYNGNYFGDPSCIVKDLNEDDYDELVISWGIGYVFVFFGGETISTAPNLQLYTGYDIVTALASAGDVNHDGYNDIIAGNFGANLVKVFYGGNPMNSSADLTFYAHTYCVGCAGDVDGNGVDDLFYHEKYFGSGANGQIFIWGDTTFNAVNENPSISIPTDFSLQQNYPNPFNSCTGISFYRGVFSQSLYLNIYNIQGQKVYTLKDDSEPNCNIHWVWNGQNQNNVLLTSGVYFLELTDGKTKQVKKMELIR
jgi:hypothetical protein